MGMIWPMEPLSNDEPTIQQLFDLTDKVALITGGSEFSALQHDHVLDVLVQNSPRY